MRTKSVLRKQKVSVDFAVIGGGLAGICAAITAARGGSSVALIQDRPVLGGNASSEIRLWALGATSHMGNNNRWSREGGVIDEILTENLYRNPEGNPIIFDTILIDAVKSEKNIILLLNTVMDACTMINDQTIRSVRAFNRQNETEYIIESPLFCDCTGDGTLGMLSGAEYIMGRDDIDYGDNLQYPADFGNLLGSTIFFYTKDTGKPVKYIPPSYAVKDLSKIEHLDRVSLDANGCDYWWIEWGGTENTIHDSENIKFSLWGIILGIWDYIKNSGRYPEAETYTLEWVGTIPGKRESRRLVGDYTLTQNDIVRQHFHEDVVSFGGWAIDHHPSEGLYSKYDSCYQWHTKGIYGIPFRIMYSRNIYNLFMGGRLISVSRVAFGSIRVMMTCAHNAQAVGAASVICKRKGILPKDIANNKDLIYSLQQYLLRDGQYIPGVASRDFNVNKALSASVEVSSELKFTGFKPDGDWYVLEHSAALLLPMNKGEIPSFSFWIYASENTTGKVEIRTSFRVENYTPEVVLDVLDFTAVPGIRQYTVTTVTKLENDCYVFLCFRENPVLKIRRSKSLISGITSVYNKFNKKVTKSSVQNPPDGSGIDSFEFWTPYRRPEAQNIAITFDDSVSIFPSGNILNGIHRPLVRSNAWVADYNDSHPYIILRWNDFQDISTMLLFFDTDYDFSMESVQIEHPERVIPFCVTSYSVFDHDTNELLYEKNNNHHARNKISFKVRTRAIRIEIKDVAGDVPPAVFGIQCW